MNLLRHCWAAAASLLLVSTAFGYSTDLPAVADSIDNIKIDLTKQAEVKNLVIERGGAKFTLQSGTITFAQPVSGRVIAAVFSGKGRFEMTPPNSAEKYMFAKLCKDSVAAWDVKEVAFFATDSFISELQQQCSFQSCQGSRVPADSACRFHQLRSG